MLSSQYRLSTPLTRSVKVLANSHFTCPLEALVGNPLHWLHCAIFSTPTKHWAKRLRDLPGGFIAISEWGGSSKGLLAILAVKTS